MNTYTHMQNMRRDNRPLPAGTWLVFDREDLDIDRAFAVFAYTEGATHDIIMISWAGKIVEPGDRLYNRECDHAEGFSDRFEMRRLAPTDVAVLDMAALHGAFYGTARRMWERLT